MVLSDVKVAEELKKENESFKQLFEQHIDFENELKKYKNRSYLSPEEQIEVKRIKKMKLLGKDQMEKLIREFKKTQ